ncbi:formyltetrahydrofolate deformylase [Castellaniella caeni]|uniref:formyltetrahydrofolate deformylase n=1 Tax=Castellaniella caeni TaxID=266123 RepID=UPI00082C6D29|nr:formyltetrahydrofolate deformylase [Castellaniella caeni]
MQQPPSSTPSAANTLFCLTVSCPSKAGQVAAIISFLDQRQGYIDEFTVFDEKSTQQFFVRCVFHTEGPQALDTAPLNRDFAELARRFSMRWTIHDMSQRPKVLILVSKLEHCLADLLFRTRMGELPMDIIAIASNHDTLRGHADAAGIAFHHLPVTIDTRPQQETAILNLTQTTGAELVILARYMQILSSETSKTLAGRAINIHHSFLPGFKGARPYHQAYERGVKVIGATAHFVTDDLDEGPIITQSVEPVDHTQTPDQLLATGRNLECRALAQAVRDYLERRVFISGHRTVVL